MMQCLNEQPTKKLVDATTTTNILFFSAILDVSVGQGHVDHITEGVHFYILCKPSHKLVFPQEFN